MSRNLSVCDWKSCLLTVVFPLLALISFSSFVFLLQPLQKSCSRTCCYGCQRFSLTGVRINAILLNWCTMSWCVQILHLLEYFSFLVGRTSDARLSEHFIRVSVFCKISENAILLQIFCNCGCNTLVSSLSQKMSLGRKNVASCVAICRLMFCYIATSFCDTKNRFATWIFA